MKYNMTDSEKFLQNPLPVFIPFGPFSNISKRWLNLLSMVDQWYISCQTFTKVSHFNYCYEWWWIWYDMVWYCMVWYSSKSPLWKFVAYSPQFTAVNFHDFQNTNTILQRDQSSILFNIIFLKKNHNCATLADIRAFPNVAWRHGHLSSTYFPQK